MGSCLLWLKACGSCRIWLPSEDLLLLPILYTAAAPELADAMVNATRTGVAYETAQSQEGHPPLLLPNE